MDVFVLRQRKIPLQVFGVSRVDAERFWGLLCRAWDTLDFSARRFLLRIWRDRRRFYKKYPVVVLASRQRFVSQFRKGAKKSIYGQYIAKSGFYFSAALLNETDNYVEAVIVHEWVHDILANLRGRDGTYFNEMPYHKLEMQVNQLVEILGFTFEKN